MPIAPFTVYSARRTIARKWGRRCRLPTAAPHCLFRSSHHRTKVGQALPPANRSASLFVLLVAPMHKRFGEPPPVGAQQVRNSYSLEGEADRPIASRGTNQIAVDISHSLRTRSGAGGEAVTNGAGSADNPSRQHMALPGMRPIYVFHVEVRMAGQQIDILMSRVLYMQQSLVDLPAALFALRPIAHAV